MDSEKYIGLDVHQATIVVAVTDSTGKLVMESILETKAATILQFFAGLRGTLSVTFEEGTWSAWLYDLLNPHVDKLVVCNPRKNALLKDGNKSDRIDARKLAELLRGNQPSASAANASGFVQIPLSQVPRRDTLGSTRVLGAGALVDRALSTGHPMGWLYEPGTP
jgi:transposase